MKLIGLRIVVTVDGQIRRTVDLLFDPLTGHKTGEILEGGKDTDENKASLKARGIEVVLLDQSFHMQARDLRQTLVAYTARRNSVIKLSS